ncbi:MAG: hypothetical protein LAQ30_21480 [Acidobacteriia bacterium]|nr:hypothetical protein [Terriglobia bacterium]
MTGWIPPVSVMSEERDAILQLVKLCKRYQVGLLAANAAIQFVAQENFQIGLALQATKNHLKAGLEEEVNIEFRQIESALLEGSEYLPALQELLCRRQPAS